ncbi:NADPH:quinone oxidoreductase family protein [Rhodococcus sp. IEGM 1408]|uniref:NADPH:quinone oxidoreductase family protein n=1 Tax=Rhodococcus sp. IEGM 1408 TaxID=3082220 RepID=UPI0029553413|nr:NADPH:quinone oxidoreductase family protein [Rhodococcus sp. IEGM 1408]MDV7999776.1 NADPH:quinone oxidoreductase family protein [Rhodococcus sp. IEGM 1408]
MRAIQISSHDGPSALEVVDLPEPEPGAVVIDVHASGVTFPEVLQTRGKYQISPPLPFVPGSEVAGVVRSAPAGSGFAAGDRVCAFPGLGGFAEVVSADPSVVFPLPDSMSFAQGASIPMNVLTVHFALAHRGRLQPGETVLVHGAGGGIGIAATQFAVASGARVIAVASTDEKRALALKAGASDAIAPEGFKDVVKELTGGEGVDIVVDPVGGDRFTDSIRSLGQEGRILVIGFTAGEIPTVKVNRLLLGNKSAIGVGWGEYWMSNPGYLQEQWAAVEPLLAAGKLDPIVGIEFPLEEASRALQLMDDRGAVGKIVLTTR